MINIGFKKLAENAIIPTKAHATDSGFDLYAAQSVIIRPEQTVVVSTGIACVLPPEHEATIRNRSGVTAKTKLRVQLGTIDNGYTGDLGVIVDNINPTRYNLNGTTVSSSELLTVKGEAAIRPEGSTTDFPVGTYIINEGDKIAQLVVTPLPAAAAYEITGELDGSERGDNGFGSTGA